MTHSRTSAKLSGFVWLWIKTPNTYSPVGLTRSYSNLYTLGVFDPSTPHDFQTFHSTHSLSLELTWKWSGVHPLLGLRIDHALDESGTMMFSLMICHQLGATDPNEITVLTWAPHVSPFSRPQATCKMGFAKQEDEMKKGAQGEDPPCGTSDLEVSKLPRNL